MDSEQAMENTFRHWKGRGMTGVFLRTDLSQAIPGQIIRHPGKNNSNSALAVFWHLIDVAMEKSDPHIAARKAGEKVGFEYWMSHPYIYSEGAPEDVGVPGVGRMVPWSYVRKYHAEHPDEIVIDLKGNKLWMVPEYAYPGMRNDKVTEFAHMARTYRPTGILASMRSEVSQLIVPPAHGDQYGFNKPVVDEMKRLYNVDILTDPRFDWQSQNFKIDDPMVEKWRELRGGYLTQLFRESRQAIREVDPKIKFGVTLSGEYIGPLLGNWKLEWRKWIDEGIVDMIVMPVFFEATLDFEADKKNYLTHSRIGKGTVSVAEVKAYIAKSKHPDIKVIHTGAPDYFHPRTPPDNADGWQCGVWFDLYTIAWFQRWEQWKRDLADQGFIKFFEQNFDEFKPQGTGASGGWGDGRYNPDLRAAPGTWYRLGDGSDDNAVATPEARRGETGNGILIKSAEFTAIHHSSPDRSAYCQSVDTAITNGKAHLEFWILRDNEQSGMTAVFSSDPGKEKDVALRIDAGTGHVSYASGEEWVVTSQVLPVKQWQLLTIDVDVDAMTYSARLGETVLCENIKIAEAKERLVEIPCIHIKTKVPSYRLFNTLNFTPVASKANRIFLDDVSVNWKPTMHFTAPGKTIVLSEDFENRDRSEVTSKNEQSEWTVTPGAQVIISDQVSIHRDGDSKNEGLVIENSTSYGPGVKCLRSSGGTSIIARPTKAIGSSGKVTLDLDVFLRSDKDYPYILPDPTTRSAHSTVIGIESAAGMLAGIDTAQSTWRLWDGNKFVDSGKPVTYDVWVHLQIAVDPQAGTCKLVVQPLGELPTPIAQGTCGKLKADEPLKLTIKPSATKGHISCYDNIVIATD